MLATEISTADSPTNRVTVANNPTFANTSLSNKAAVIDQRTSPSLTPPHRGSCYRPTHPPSPTPPSLTPPLQGSLL
ncbi:hypothetical protein F4810DRAFT_711226 [Camillea tinctor]|nr:hypothetical protein F4810DRAFT_711226 [Camillea tinctor]